MSSLLLSLFLLTSTVLSAPLSTSQPSLQLNRRQGQEQQQPQGSPTSESTREPESSEDSTTPSSANLGLKLTLGLLLGLFILCFLITWTRRFLARKKADYVPSDALQRKNEERIKEMYNGHSSTTFRQGPPAYTSPPPPPAVQTRSERGSRGETALRGYVARIQKSQQERASGQFGGQQMSQVQQVLGPRPAPPAYFSNSSLGSEQLPPYSR